MPGCVRHLLTQSGILQWRLLIFVPGIDVSSSSKQPRQHLQRASTRLLSQLRKSPWCALQSVRLDRTAQNRALTSGILNIGTMKLADTCATGSVCARLQRAAVSSPVQRCRPLAIPQVNIAARGERRLRCADVISRCCGVQRRRRCLHTATH